MIPDTLDDLLDRSAPAARAADGDGLRAMIIEARREGWPRRARLTRIALGAGLVALLVGGAGVATANSDWLWGSGMADPDHSFTYESPTWGHCELRFGRFEASNPFDQAAIDQVIDEWFATADLEAAAAPLIPKYLAQLEADQAAQDDPITDPRAADLNYWIAADQAVGELLHRELTAHGFDGSAGTGLSGGASQVHCDGEQWQ